MSGAFSEDVHYRMATHPFNMEDAKKEISEICKQGYIPVGLDVKEETAFYILYIKGLDLYVENWFLYQTQDFESLEKEYTSLIIKQGWVPMDIARTEKGLYTLFIKTNLEIKGWYITDSEKDEQAINDITDFMQAKGYLSWGISIYEDKVWHLFLRTDGISKDEFKLLTYKYDPDIVADGIGANIKEAWLPWGLMMETNKVSILFAR